MIALLALPLLLQEPSGRVPAFDPKQPLEIEELGDEIDLSLHWLHTRYDAARGTFGSLEADAWVLLAYAESPRHYRPSEGPFMARPLAGLLAAQRADGSFDPAVPAATVLWLFETLQEDATRAAAERLRAVVHDPAPRPQPSSVDAARARAKAILLTRQPDGSFGGVVESARA